jgi:predicted component of type VI protein secretion system
MANLINITPGSNKEIIPMNRVVLLVGQKNGEHLDLANGKLTQNHASIIELGDGFYLRDHGSQAGSFLNEEPVVEGRLDHLDIVRFGSYQFLVDLKDQFHSQEAKAQRLERTQTSHQVSALKYSIADDEPWETVEEVISAFAAEKTLHQLDLSHGVLPDEPLDSDREVGPMKMIVVTPKAETVVSATIETPSGVRNGDLKESPVYLEALEASLKPRFQGASLKLTSVRKSDADMPLRKTLQDSLEGESLSGRWGIGKPGSIEEAG